MMYGVKASDGAVVSQNGNGSMYNVEARGKNTRVINTNRAESVTSKNKYPKSKVFIYIPYFILLMSGIIAFIANITTILEYFNIKL